MKSKNILLMGIWLIIIPFLGVPSSWKSFLLFATGFILILTYVKNRHKDSHSLKTTPETFVENRENVQPEQ